MILPRKTRIVSIIQRLAHFLTAQAFVQGLNLLNGFLLIRAMARQEYAVYSLALGCQLTLSGLTEIGLGGSIIALVGSRGGSPEIVGQYVRSASIIRTWLVCGSAVVGFAVIPRLLKSSGLSPWALTLMLVAILAALYFQCWSSYYDTPLLINGNLSGYYKPQLIAGIGRLVLTAALWSLGYLRPMSAIWLMTAYYVAIGAQYRIAVRKLITIPKSNVSRHTREIVRYLIPLVPGTLYAAFAGQLSLFIIGWFGAKYEIAGIAALGRIGQLFFLLNAANSTLIMPALAKASHSGVVQRYFMVLALSVGASSCIFMAFLVFPALVTFLLGSTYKDLVQVIPLALGTSCLSYVSGTMWTMHAARKWIFWWGGSVQVLVALFIQLLSVRLLPLGSIRGVLQMNLYVAVGSIVVQIVHAIVGFSDNVPKIVVPPDQIGNRAGVLTHS